MTLDEALREPAGPSQGHPISVIAMIAGDEDTRRGPIPIALAHAGFETREPFTTDEADHTVRLHGAKRCVLIVDGRALDRRAGSATWSGFLARHRSMSAVVVTLGEARPEVEVAAGEHRILLERPFDAAAVVAAVRRASASRRPAVRRARQPLREAG